MPVKEKINNDYPYARKNDFSSAFLKRMGLSKSKSEYFKVVPVDTDDINIDVDGKKMPPLEDLKPEFVAEMKASREKDDGIICNSKKERQALFAKVWSEDE